MGCPLKSHSFSDPPAQFVPESFSVHRGAPTLSPAASYPWKLALKCLVVGGWLSTATGCTQAGISATREVKQREATLQVWGADSKAGSLSAACKGPWSSKKRGALLSQGLCRVEGSFIWSADLYKNLTSHSTWALLCAFPFFTALSHIPNFPPLNQNTLSSHMALHWNWNTEL